MAKKVENVLHETLSNPFALRNGCNTKKFDIAMGIRRTVLRKGFMNTCKTIFLHIVSPHIYERLLHNAIFWGNLVPNVNIIHQTAGRSFRIHEKSATFA